MKFCPKCGSILIPEKKKNIVTYVCKKCGYKEDSGINELKFEEKIQKEKLNEDVIERKIDTLPKIKAECPKCGNKEAYYWTMQTRAGDEAETRFYRCTKCGYTWREYD